MPNNRIFYATQAVALKPQSDAGIYSSWYFPRGVQSVGITTNFGLEQVFQLGQLELYENVENVPEIEVTINKAIDGTPCLWTLCMGGATGINGANDKEMVELANNRVNFRLGIYPDTVSAATGVAPVYVDCSGMYLSSASYTIPVEGNATEDITLVGNNKVWNSGYFGAGFAGAFSNTTTAGDVGGTMTAPAIARRYKFNKVDSLVPTGVGGGIPVADGQTKPYLQNITISTDLGREAIYELGRMAPYHRYVTFPVEVTSEFEVIAASGDQVQANDFSSSVADCATPYRNLQDKEVKIVICGSGSSDSLTIDLGNKNKLTSVNYSGGDTGGGNATVTYSYQTYNKLKITGSNNSGFVNVGYVDATNTGGIVGD
jgi:hypothetical protein